MKNSRPSTIDEYIRAAPAVAQPHLNELYALLRNVAPKAAETIKWGNPFFVDPRFLFAFSAHKSHLSFAPGPDTMEAFQQDLASYKTTKNFLQVPYADSLPADLIRKMAKYRIKSVSARQDDSFW